MHGNEIYEALKLVAGEHRIAMEDLVELITEGVTAAARKRLERDDVTARFDDDRKEFVLYETMLVAEGEPEAFDELSLDDARKIDPEAQAGGTVERVVKMADLGRIAAQSVRQTILRRGRELERRRLAEECRARVGELVTAPVARQVERTYVFDLEGMEAQLPPGEQLIGEKIERNRPYRMVIAGAVQEPRMPVPVVSRTHPDLVRRLMEREVPELADGSVELAAVVRDPSGRSKVAVKTRRADVDPVGACVGARGVRIQAVVKELSGEKIDIFPWTDDRAELIVRALTPARREGLEVRLAPDGDAADVIVTPEQLSAAIGRKGVNVRLASRLCGCHLDVMSAEEYAAKQERLAASRGGAQGEGRESPLHNR